MTTDNSGDIEREPADEGRERLTIGTTGSGKTYASLAAMWNMLQADDDQDTDDDVPPMTDQELDEALAAVMRRDVEPLPADIEALSDVTPYLLQPTDPHKRVKTQFRSRRRPAGPFNDHRRARRELLERGYLEDLGSLIQDVLRSNWQSPRSNWEFYWDCGETEHSRTMRELREALDSAYESVMQMRAPYRQASEDAASFLSLGDWSTDAPKLRAPWAAGPSSWRDSPSLTNCCTPPPQPHCCAPQRAEEPWYLLAVFVQPERSMSQDRPGPPAWFTCADSAVTRAPAPSVARGRWSVVVDFEAAADVSAAHNVALSAAVIELSSTSAPTFEQPERIRSLWQSNWRPRVLELLESAK
ncbi:hypothetical protein AB0G49_13815 [Streptomyces longwoodensis]|uniref:hypothetical protein n=1 Tax=Streptomyces longwoodensis TaxID=68231 RepID=UPI0033DA6D30